MNSKTIALLCCLSLAAFGCDDNPETDGGVDSGRIDSGPRTDAGFDAGGPMVDSGFDAGVDAGPPVPRGMANPPTLGTQIDRAGRPAITTASVGTFMAPGAPRDALKDNYNLNSDPTTWSAMYRDGIADMIAIYDGIDGTDAGLGGCGNQLSDGTVVGDDAARYDFLAGVLVDDRLIILSATGTGHSREYLGAEALVLTAETGVDAATAGSGGRNPIVDVVDRSYSVLVDGSLGGYGDSVDFGDIPTVDQPDPDVFPFLPAP